MPLLPDCQPRDDAWLTLRQLIFSITPPAFVYCAAQARYAREAPARECRAALMRVRVREARCHARAYARGGAQQRAQQRARYAPFAITLLRCLCRCRTMPRDKICHA